MSARRLWKKAAGKVAEAEKPAPVRASDPRDPQQLSLDELKRQISNMVICVVVTDFLAEKEAAADEGGSGSRNRNRWSLSWASPPLLSKKHLVAAEPLRTPPTSPRTASPPQAIPRQCATPPCEQQETASLSSSAKDQQRRSWDGKKRLQSKKTGGLSSSPSGLYSPDRSEQQVYSPELSSSPPSAVSLLRRDNSNNNSSSSSSGGGGGSKQHNSGNAFADTSDASTDDWMTDELRSFRSVEELSVEARPELTVWEIKLHIFQAKRFAAGWHPSKIQLSECQSNRWTQLDDGQTFLDLVLSNNTLDIIFQATRNDQPVATRRRLKRPKVDPERSFAATLRPDSVRLAVDGGDSYFYVFPVARDTAEPCPLLPAQLVVQLREKKTGCLLPCTYRAQPSKRFAHLDALVVTVVPACSGVCSLQVYIASSSTTSQSSNQTPTLSSSSGSTIFTASSSSSLLSLASSSSSSSSSLLRLIDILPVYNILQASMPLSVLLDGHMHRAALTLLASMAARSSSTEHAHLLRSLPLLLPYCASADPWLRRTALSVLDATLALDEGPRTLLLTCDSYDLWALFRPSAWHGYAHVTRFLVTVLQTVEVFDGDARLWLPLFDTLNQLSHSAELLHRKVAAHSWHKLARSPLLRKLVAQPGQPAQSLFVASLIELLSSATSLPELRFAASELSLLTELVLSTLVLLAKHHVDVSPSRALLKLVEVVFVRSHVVQLRVLAAAVLHGFACWGHFHYAYPEQLFDALIRIVTTPLQRREIASDLVAAMQRHFGQTAQQSAAVASVELELLGAALDLCASITTNELQAATAAAFRPPSAASSSSASLAALPSSSAVSGSPTSPPDSESEHSQLLIYKLAQHDELSALCALLPGAPPALKIDVIKLAANVVRCGGDAHERVLHAGVASVLAQLLDPDLSAAVSTTLAFFSLLPGGFRLPPHSAASDLAVERLLEFTESAAAPPEQRRLMANVVAQLLALNGQQQQRCVNRRGVGLIKLLLDFGYTLSDMHTELPPHALTFIEPIGRGAASQVWRAVYQNRHVAVKKFFKEDLSFSPRAFAEELMITSNFVHPTLIEAVGACTKECWLVTEYCPRGDLAVLFGRPDYKYSPLWTLQLAIDLADGLGYLHQAGLMHRDVKAENVLIRDDWRIAIADLGTARVLFSRARSLTRSVGTPAYQAPEVFSDSYTESIDVFSWSLVVWESIFVAKFGRAFSNNRSARVYDLVRQGVRPPTDFDSASHSAEDAAMSLSLIDIVQQSWDADPARRPSCPDLFKRLVLLKQAYYGQVEHLPPPLRKGSVLLQRTTSQKHIAFVKREREIDLHLGLRTSLEKLRENEQNERIRQRGSRLGKRAVDRNKQQPASPPASLPSPRLSDASSPSPRPSIHRTRSTSDSRFDAKHNAASLTASSSSPSLSLAPPTILPDRQLVSAFSTLFARSFPSSNQVFSSTDSHPSAINSSSINPFAINPSPDSQSINQLPSQAFETPPTTSPASSLPSSAASSSSTFSAASASPVFAFSPPDSSVLERSSATLSSRPSVDSTTTDGQSRDSWASPYPLLMAPSENKSAPHGFLEFLSDSLDPSDVSRYVLGYRTVEQKTKKADSLRESGLSLSRYLHTNSTAPSPPPLLDADLELPTAWLKAKPSSTPPLKILLPPRRGHEG